MNAQQIVEILVTALLNGAAVVISYLYKEQAKSRQDELERTIKMYETRITKLDTQLETEQKARINAAETNTKWVLDLQQKSHDDLEKTAAIAEALIREREQRGRMR